LTSSPGNVAVAVWPPPLVKEVDPVDFGVRTGAAGPRGRNLNPYVPRDIDASLDRALEKDRAVLLTAEEGSGTKRTVYEALNRILPDAHLLVAAGPGRFDPARLLDVNLRGDVVLWIDALGAHEKASGDALWDGLAGWLQRPGRRLVATHHGADVPRRALVTLGATMVDLPAELSPAERKAMRDAYGEVSISTSIGRNPPVRKTAEQFSGSVRDIARAAGSAPVSASALAERLRRRHAEYAHRLFGSAHLDDHAGDGGGTVDGGLVRRVAPVPGRAALAHPAAGGPHRRAVQPPAPA
jgi:hypothetical protein